jgi:guanylate kinase
LNSCDHKACKTFMDCSDPPKGFFMVVSAPSGTGKTSICREFMRLCPDVRFSVSYTTRPSRPGEREGVDYHFISEASFRERIGQNAFAEWTENYGYLYGTSIHSMRHSIDSGCNLLLDLEPGGAGALKKNYPGGVFVFILPPSIDDLKQRLSKRGETPEVIRTRLHKVMDEIKEVIWYDYIIINDNFDHAVNCLRSIYIAEMSRRERLAVRLKPFLAN